MTALAGNTENASTGSAEMQSGPMISASRASSRRSVQASTMPGGSSVSRSFSEWTAKSMRRSASASWISFENRPLPPISASERSCTVSPVVRMTCSSNTSSLLKPGASTGQKLASRRMNTRVCTRASGEPRVPTRSGRPRRAWDALSGIMAGAVDEEDSGVGWASGIEMLYGIAGSRKRLQMHICQHPVPRPRLASWPRLAC